VKSALLRGPQRIRNRGQAVSPDDFEWLVYENFPSIAKVKCLPNTSINGKFTAGKITIVLVPSSSKEKPVASLGLISKVQQYLEEHSSNVVVTSKNLKVIRPLYLRISIFVDVYPVSIDFAPVAEQAVITRLKVFLNPLTGGPEGKGWDFGRMVCTSDIFFLLENIVEIDHVDNLSIKVEIDEDTLLQSTRESILHTSSFSSSSYSSSSFSATSSSSISIDKTAGVFPDPPLPPYSLIYSGKHTVTLKFEKGNGGE
jgi:hypothetical protein